MLPPKTENDGRDWKKKLKIIAFLQSIMGNRVTTTLVGLDKLLILYRTLIVLTFFTICSRLILRSQ